MDEFLANVRPHVECVVPNLWRSNSFQQALLTLPTIRLECSNELCGGERLFEPLNNSDNDRLDFESFRHVLLKYQCKNCDSTPKWYSCFIQPQRTNDKAGTIIKMGEFPDFGRRLPNKLVRLMSDEDRADFLKGFRSETSGLGVGAFTYYRRVLEKNKDRLFEKIIAVARNSGMSESQIAGLEDAHKHFQFKKSVTEFKEFLPPSILMSGHNPLTLLHNALSEGLHSDSDENCLELAIHIRTVLAELAIRISNSLIDQIEIKTAISRLTMPKQSTVSAPKKQNGGSH